MTQLLDRSQFLIHFVYGIGSTHPTEQKINDFKKLGPGWHFGQGESFSKEAIDKAIALHHAIVYAGCSETDAFPGFNGEIQISVYQLPKSCEITIRKDGRWLIVFEEGDQECFECSGENLLPVLPDIVGMICTWNTFTSYHINTGSQPFVDSPVLLSSPRTPTEASPSSTWNVQLDLTEQCVRTLETSTLGSQENPPYFGRCLKIFYQTPPLSFRPQAPEETPATATSPD